MPRHVLDDMLIDLGQYGYAGQVGQNPTPPGGGMFKVDKIDIVDRPSGRIGKVVRFWDKAGSQGGGAYTAGVKMTKLDSGKYCILDVQRGQWSTDIREQRVKETALMDGKNVYVYMEQEPGSSGKDSVLYSARNLDGFSVHAERPSGDKVLRADPFSVQVNLGNVEMVRGSWNNVLKDEIRFFPVGLYKDQVDALSGAYKALSKPKAGKW
jgi:predicted phage terminase large subunit-like protein